jgi:hypothetical protein
MAYDRSGGRSGSGNQRSEVGDQRSSRILKFSIRKLFNPQFAILFAHIRSSLSVLDLLQHLLLEALADGVDQNFLTARRQIREVIWSSERSVRYRGLERRRNTAEIGLCRPATGEWFLDLNGNGNGMVAASMLAFSFSVKTREIYPWWDAIYLQEFMPPILDPIGSKTDLPSGAGRRTYAKNFFLPRASFDGAFPSEAEGLRTCSAPLRELTTRASRNKSFTET